MSLLRRLCIILHRYVGLMLAVFLSVAGLTGSLLVFYHELDAALNPALMQIDPRFDTLEPLDPLTLRERLETEHHVRVNYVSLDMNPGQAIRFWAEPVYEDRSRDDKSADDEYFVDPYTGNVFGSRKWGDISQGIKNLMPFLYKLHFSLALGEVGSYLFGVVALLWTLDCFVGAYLTFPPPRKQNSDSQYSSTWISLWGKSWLVKTGSLYKLTFTWHRASGLWLWGLLFVFAWSAVGLNLNQVYRPVMQAMFGMKDQVWQGLPDLNAPRHDTKLTWQAALLRGRHLMASESRKRDFEIFQETTLSYDAAKGLFRYRVRSSRDVTDHWGATTVWFDGNTGAFVAFEAATGQDVGQTITAWFRALHFATVGGLAYRITVSIVGVLTALLSISGVYIWWVKRRARTRRV